MQRHDFIATLGAAMAWVVAATNTAAAMTAPITFRLGMPILLTIGPPLHRS